MEGIKEKNFSKQANTAINMIMHAHLDSDVIINVSASASLWNNKCSDLCHTYTAV